MKAICPLCDDLIEITPNGVDPKVSDKRARLVVHKDKRAQMAQLCLGSGKDV